VRQLREGANKTPIPAHELDPYGKRLLRFDYEVAEYLDFPPVEPFDFFHGQFRTFPPALEPDEFTILTVEVEPTVPTTQGLEPFDITVATLTRSDETEEWEIQREQRQAYRYIELLPDAQTLEMVAIPGGTFTMGSTEDEEGYDSYDGPQHEVTVEPFFMGRYPVTQAQWRVVAALPQVERNLDLDPSNFKGDNRPVEQVSWYDAVEFCARLAVHTGREYRLPTEAEWEHACRAGTTTPFHFGETITTDIANYKGTDEQYGAYGPGPKGEYRGETTPVDHFGVANAFGLHDMHGNVWEWCQDNWHENYEGAPTDGSAWLTDNNEAFRIGRGGSWFSSPRTCRSACRYHNVPDIRDFNIGFRVVCAAPRTL
jgi:formylglycine-generating enzyme required for sulfatase activity